MTQELEGNDRTDQWFSFIAYIDKYKAEGIEFINFIDKSYVLTKKIAEGNKDISPIEIGKTHINWITNTVIDNEMVERFCLRLWKDYEQVKTEKRFIQEQIEYLEKLNDWIKNEYKYQYWPILKFFEDAQNNNGFKNKTSESKSQNNTIEITQESAIRDVTISTMGDLKKDKESNKTTVPPLPTKTQKLKEHFSKYGFLELQKIKTLNNVGIEKLIGIISKNKLPYQIAMINFLGFIEHLKKEHFKNDKELSIEISKWFTVEESGRTVRGNIKVLGYSEENKKRYTANKYIEEVQRDYNMLK